MMSVFPPFPATEELVGEAAPTTQETTAAKKENGGYQK
jgi:hypothetical protein